MLKLHPSTNPGFALLLRAVILLLLTGFLSVYAQKESTPVSPWKGREIFQQKGCVNCHAIHGKGGERGPDLGKNNFYGTYLDLATQMWNHFPKMMRRMKAGDMKIPEFNAEEIRQLIAYLSYQRYRCEPGNEFTGRKLLKSKKCFSCHKFGGEGGNIGPDISQKKESLSPLMLVEYMWNHGPDMMELFEEHNIKRPEFKGNDISDIAVAIQSYMQPTNKVPIGAYDLGEPVKGKKLVQEKNCLKCHSIHEEGGGIGPNFEEVDLNCSVTQIAGKMWNHGPKMWEYMKKEGISIPKFKPGEMADVIAYLYGIQFEESPGDVNAGYELISQKDCLACHSLNGEGAGISTDFAELEGLDSPLAMITVMWNHASEMFEKRTKKNLKWPKFKGREMANLYAYLVSISALTKQKK